MRPTRVSRDVQAGCETCSGDVAKWTGGQAQGTAARHFDQTGHPTWVEVFMHVSYGGAAGRVAVAAKPKPKPAAGAIAGFVGLAPRGPRR
jgi:hypothetical protein